MAAPIRCIFLTGAPEVDFLSWDEQDLLRSFGTPINRFLDGRSEAHYGTSVQKTPTGFPKWRNVECDKPTVWKAIEAEEVVEGTQFLSFEHDLREVDEHEQLGFLDHSIAILDEIDSTRILASRYQPEVDLGTDLQTNFKPTGSFATTSQSSSSFQTSNGSFIIQSPSRDGQKATDVEVAGPVTNLKRIPHADYITRIQPQTMTVNLIVGVITVSPARTVRLRRRDAEMDIIELTVGDETRAGFGVSFWLAPLESQRRSSDDLRNAIKRLRTGDVVLLQNVALSCFRGCVYGQSLSKKFAMNSTSITVLANDLGHVQLSSVLAKVNRVKEWTENFVGVSGRPRVSFMEAKLDKTGQNGKNLPPDTQD